MMGNGGESGSNSSNTSAFEFKLNSPPDDGITRVRFAPYSSQWLLVSSWDSTVRFYDLESNSQRGRFNRQLAVLDATFESDKSKIYSGGIDNLLTLSDVSTGIDTVVGNHEKPISCVEYCPEMNLILTGSWDWSLKMWDPRSNNALKGTFSQP